MKRQIDAPKNKNIGSHLYASGRIAMLEEKLIPGNVMESLTSVESESAILHKISTQYQGENLDEALEMAEMADIELYSEVASEAAYIEMFLIPKEAHNIRRVLKLLLASDPQAFGRSSQRSSSSFSDEDDRDIKKAKKSAIEDDESFLLPYISSPEQLYTAVKKFSSLITQDSGIKDLALVGAQLEKPLNEWVEVAVAEAIAKFKKTGEASDISFSIDKAALKRMAELADQSKNIWLKNWVKLSAALTDLALVLRCRHLFVSPKVAKERATEVSGINPKKLYELCAANELLFPTTLREILKEIPAISEGDREKLYHMALHYAEEGPSAFSALNDEIKISVLRKASRQFGTQEQVFAYFAFREYERKNLRLVLAGVANDLDSERIKKMLRPSFRREALR